MRSLGPQLTGSLSVLYECLLVTSLNLKKTRAFRQATVLQHLIHALSSTFQRMQRPMVERKTEEPKTMEDHDRSLFFILFILEDLWMRSACSICQAVCRSWHLHKCRSGCKTFLAGASILNDIGLLKLSEIHFRKTCCFVVRF